MTQRAAVKQWNIQTLLPFPPAACVRCTAVSNILGYIEDTCDCARYYTCQLYESGWKAIHSQCPICQLWDQSIITCGIVIPNCVDDTITTTTGRFAASLQTFAHFFVVTPIFIVGGFEKVWKKSRNRKLNWTWLSPSANHSIQTCVWNPPHTWQNSKIIMSDGF